MRTMPAFLRTAAIVSALAFSLASGGCSTNPATGQQSFTAFMSPGEEAKVGAQEHPKILKEFGGAYADRGLAEYVTQIGSTIARNSELPDLKFTFTVLNDQKVNAFALPGGYVYITRGLLAVAETEAEMAGVLAHEIGHITARHSAQRYSQAMAANIGMTVLGVIGQIAGVPGAAGDLAAFGAQAVLQGYSREQELEADMLGVRYLARVGYSPDAMTSFFKKLDAHSRLEAKIAGTPEAADKYSIMSTHPRTADRIEQAIRLANTARVENPRINRDIYLSHIAGIAFGDDPKQGIRRGREFVHPELGFRFAVPPGFTLFNSPKQVVARGPEQAMIVFDMVDPKKARTVSDMAAYVARDWGGKLGIQDVERIDVNGMGSATGTTRIRTRAGTMDVRLLALRGGPDRIFRMIFLTPPNLTQKLQTDLQRTTYSFQRLTPQQAAEVRPLTVKLVKAKAGDTAESLSRSMPFESYHREWFEVLNGLSPGQALVPGQTYKTITD